MDLEAEIIKELLVPLDDAFLQGVKHIYCYRPPDGSCPAKDFLDCLPPKVLATYVKQFEKVCAGHHLRGDRWHPWTEDDGKGCKGLFEYKDISSKTRIMHLIEGKIHVLLFGFGGKKEDKVANEHVVRALRMKSEYARRRADIQRRFEQRGKYAKRS